MLAALDPESRKVVELIDFSSSRDRARHILLMAETRRSLLKYRGDGVAQKLVRVLWNARWHLKWGTGKKGCPVAWAFRQSFVFSLPFHVDHITKKGERDILNVVKEYAAEAGRKETRKWEYIAAFFAMNGITPRKLRDANTAVQKQSYVEPRMKAELTPEKPPVKSKKNAAK